MRRFAHVLGRRGVQADGGVLLRVRLASVPGPRIPVCGPQPGVDRLLARFERHARPLRLLAGGASPDAGQHDGR
eukprot:4255824-Prymnesium_polylepis.1